METFDDVENVHKNRQLVLIQLGFASNPSHTKFLHECCQTKTKKTKRGLKKADILKRGFIFMIFHRLRPPGLKLKVTLDPF